jgi:CRISPR-associated protein Cas2
VVVLYVLVVYDISDNKVRSELANYLKVKGFTRIQRSAFIGRPPPSVLRDVERVLPRYIKSESDVIHLIPLLEYSVKHVKVYGRPLAEFKAEGEVVVFY